MRLVLGGEPKGVFTEFDYLKLNTGVMLLRVHSWTLSLLRRMLKIGRREQRWSSRPLLLPIRLGSSLHAGRLKDTAKHSRHRRFESTVHVPSSSQQPYVTAATPRSPLIPAEGPQELMRWLYRRPGGAAAVAPRRAIPLENSNSLGASIPDARCVCACDTNVLPPKSAHQAPVGAIGYWEDYEDALPATAAFSVATQTQATFVPLRLIGSTPLPRLKKAVFGGHHVPFAIHFAGCQLCSGKTDVERSIRCWRNLRQAIRFAEDQTLMQIGLRHSIENRSASRDLPLEGYNTV